jgi:hypothetical protein
MTTINYNIPLTLGAQNFAVDLGNGDYRFRLLYRDADEAGWCLDIDGPNEIAIHGIPLLVGVDLLWQYTYFGIPGQLFARRLNDGPEAFSYADMGRNIELLYVVP